MANCSKCGEPLGDDGPRAGVCKWCASEQAIKEQQARGPTYSPSPSYAPARGGGSGMSTFTILRLALFAVAILFALARHC